MTLPTWPTTTTVVLTDGAHRYQTATIGTPYLHGDEPVVRVHGMDRPVRCSRLTPSGATGLPHVSARDEVVAGTYARAMMVGVG